MTYKDYGVFDTEVGDLVDDTSYEKFVNAPTGSQHIHLKDNVDKPDHYTRGSIEVIDFILDQHMDYMEGNVVKYISRYKYKNGVEDLRKAKWYIEKLIKEQCDL